MNKVLEVVGCCSSVARALVANARGPGFDSPATTKIFSHFAWVRFYLYILYWMLQQKNFIIIISMNFFLIILLLLFQPRMPALYIYQRRLHTLVVGGAKY